MIGAFEDQSDYRADAESWVARFAPLLLHDDAAMPEPEVRRRIELAKSLSYSAPTVLAEFQKHEQPADFELSSTLHQAVAQLPSIEEDLRRRLAKLAPGDPTGIVDYDALQDRLEERAARQEIGESTELQLPPILDEELAKGNIAGATGALIFGAGWTGFTLFHCIIMLGGMWAAFGPLALFLLLFYSIFFAVGFAMLYSAFTLASNERIRLEGRNLTIIRSFKGITRTTHHKLGPDSVAKVGTTTASFRMNSGNRNSSNSAPTPALILHDVNGKELALGSNSTDERRSKLVARINAYLRIHT